jgi:CCR4-NOT transcription complex subunit 4
MVREASKEGSDSGDGSALPSSASWANRGTQNRSRRPSNAASAAESSPAISHTMPDLAETTKEHEDSNVVEEETIQPQPTKVDTPPPPPPSDPILRKILEAISRLEVTNSADDASSTVMDDFPPLFTDDGGLKRRAMREEQEEARLLMEQESRIDSRQAPEPQEEEEPESGSLQLGGEPEDREDSREAANQTPGFHDQRRPSSQLPIQRASNDAGLFAGQGFAQNITSLGNLGGVNGRSLTPAQQQQILLAKFGQPQSGFVDQFPVNSASQPSLFQQQGHNRQSSRYNFANDAASSTSNSKTTINPKLPGQQSSMMAQQGNQSYGSMPGPPPGLKSTGTPVNGAMFGQSHGFGGALGGSGFGMKENGNEMLREMLRRGGATGGGQGYDAGKREFMFPSFLHQYPSNSSTPAPASGLLASLNGHHPGAFHDFGPKQKKKGKKHRHANTSSSGGGGLVDLADPNILQARMPHQQQSNAGGGQGLFGGQAQGGYSQNMMYGSGFPRW